MSFIHNATKKCFYSIEDKIKHYSDISKGRKTYKNVTKTYARKRLSELKELRNRTFDNPDLVVVNDTHFGNKGDKPRLAVVIGRKNEFIRVSPFHKRKTNALVLDNYTEYQLDERGGWVKDKDVYETKYIEPVYPLSNSDKKKSKCYF